MDLEQLEAIALDENREEALNRLTPGTSDYYFYHCLQLLHQKAFDEVPGLLAQWSAQHGREARMAMIENRLLLLRHGTRATRACGELIQRLNLHFDHHREVEQRKTSLPSVLDPTRLSRKTIKKEVFARNSQRLEGFSDHALDWLAEERLNPLQTQQLLSRVSRPDTPGLVKLIDRDLKERKQVFGKLKAHQLLMPSQMDELRRLHPQLDHEEPFVLQRLRLILPGPDTDWQHDDTVQEACFTQLWNYASALPPIFNSLKANILYHRLAFDRRRGLYDREKFLNYLRLPKAVPYVAASYLKEVGPRQHHVNLTRDYSAHIGLGPIHNDTVLVDDYLEHLLRDEPDTSAYEPLLEAGFLRKTFARTKLLHDVGDPEQWYGLWNDPRALEQFRDQVEITPAPGNPLHFKESDPVSLEIDLKNITTLVIKIYEINTLNWFKIHGRDVNMTVDLDGLLPIEEQTHTYTTAPTHRHRERFEPELVSRPGVFVVDFIGSGLSSRALIRKGSLRHLERHGAAGHVFTIFNEDNQPLPQAVLWMNGQEYAPDEKGEIHIPYATRPGRVPFLLCHEGLTTAGILHHLGESYRLRAGLFVDRESLLAGEQATVLIRPALYLNEMPVSLTLLEETKLLIRSTDQDGVSSSMEVTPFALHQNRESVFSFQVPPELASVSFTLKGRVRAYSTGKDIDLSETRTFQVNLIDKTAYTSDLHLTRSDSGYVLSLLGKTGEPRSGTAVQCTFTHRDFTDPITLALQTDKQGRIELGPLMDITTVKAQCLANSEQWYLREDACAWPAVIHLPADETLRVPVMGLDRLRKEGQGIFARLFGATIKPTRDQFSLLEVHGRYFLNDCFSNLSLKDGFLVVDGLSPGDYSLLIKNSNQIRIRITAGTRHASWIMSPTRLLESRNPRPIQIGHADIDGHSINIKVEQATAETRVHLFGTRFLPAWSPYNGLFVGGPPQPRQATVVKSSSTYASGRDIGDEYRYILERRYATKHIGNMLAHPSLLLNPWAIRKTDSGLQEPAAAGAYGGGGSMDHMALGGAPAAPPPPDEQLTSFTNLDFLGQTTRLWTNLKPDSNGVIKLDIKDLAGVNVLGVLAVDRHNTVFREINLGENDAECRDLRLLQGLPAGVRVSQQKQITPLLQGRKLVLEDVRTTRLECFSSLDAIYRLFTTLTKDKTLAEFSFILRWPETEMAEKQRLYSRHACHELHLFLYFKDPDFFAAVVKPYLAFKKEKTFLDHWFLDEDLTAYLEPWAYGRLNVLEQILLSRRIDGAQEEIARRIGNDSDLIAPDRERENLIFETGLQGSALDADAGSPLPPPAAAPRRVRKVKGEIFQKRASKPAGPPAMAAPAMAMAKAEMEEEVLAESLADEELGCYGEEDDLHDLEKREQVQRFFRSPEKTEEWAENNYYRLRIHQQTHDLITANPFWHDFARHDGKTPFLSRAIARATGNFSEMMAALAVTDLAFSSTPPKSTPEDHRLTLEATANTIVFHEELKVADETEPSSLLLGQHYLRDDDRHEYVDGERVDRYVQDEFLIHTVYICQVVIGNPTSSRLKLDLLLQIPHGAMPVSGGKRTRSQHLVLDPFATQTREYRFYFPDPGEWSHLPAQASRDGKPIAVASAGKLKVVGKFTTIDQASWPQLSQHGTDREVLDYLKGPTSGDSTCLKCSGASRKKHSTWLCSRSWSAAIILMRPSGPMR